MKCGIVCETLLKADAGKVDRSLRRADFDLWIFASAACRADFYECDTEFLDCAKPGSLESVPLETLFRMYLEGRAKK